MQQDTHQWTRKRTDDAFIQLNVLEPSVPLALTKREKKKRKDYAFWRQCDEQPSTTPGLPRCNKGGLTVQIHQELHDSLVSLHGSLLDSAPGPDNKALNPKPYLYRSTRSCMTALSPSMALSLILPTTY